MEIRNIVNSLIEDIASGASISQILLKAQIVAFHVGDESFSHYVKCEQQGYSPEDIVPGYRIQKTMVKATFVGIYNNVQTVEVHCEAIEDKRIRDLMTNVRLNDPLVQVESMYRNAESGMVKVQVPVFAYPTIKSLYKNRNVEIQSSYHYFPKEALLVVVETFKSQLLDLLMQFDQKLDWDIELSSGKNKDIATTIIHNVYQIQAVVANTGSGNVDTQDIKLVK